MMYAKFRSELVLSRAFRWKLMRYLAVIQNTVLFNVDTGDLFKCQHSIIDIIISSLMLLLLLFSLLLLLSVTAFCIVATILEMKTIRKNWISDKIGEGKVTVIDQNIFTSSIQMTWISDNIIFIINSGLISFPWHQWNIML